MTRAKKLAASPLHSLYKGDTENGIWGGPEWDVSMPVMWEWYQEVFHPGRRGAVTLGN